MKEAEIEMLRGVGCREAKEGEPESGPCGVCLKCAEERGAKWAIEAVIDTINAPETPGGIDYEIQCLDIENVCRAARGK